MLQILLQSILLHKYSVASTINLRRLHTTSCILWVRVSCALLVTKYRCSPSLLPVLLPSSLSEEELSLIMTSVKTRRAVEGRAAKGPCWRHLYATAQNRDLWSLKVSKMRRATTRTRIQISVKVRTWTRLTGTVQHGTGVRGTVQYSNAAYRSDFSGCIKRYIGVPGVPFSSWSAECMEAARLTAACHLSILQHT